MPVDDQHRRESLRRLASGAERPRPRAAERDVRNFPDERRFAVVQRLLYTNVTAVQLGFLAIVMIVALWFIDGTRYDRDYTPSPLVSTQFVPAGTPGKSIVVRQQGFNGELVTPISDPDERLVYDAEYLRGRVAVVDVHPHQPLRKADFEHR
jgi:hypothetical protein